MITILLLFLFLFLNVKNDLASLSTEYLELLGQRPLPMDRIDEMETKEFSSIYTEDKILSDLAPYKTLDKILYSNKLNYTTPKNDYVETAGRMKYNVGEYEFFFNIIFTVVFTKDEEPLIEGLFSKYNYTPPTYSNTTLFREVSVPVGPLELPGLLTIPNPDYFSKPIGVVNLIAGSGQGDEDETIHGDKPFKDLAWGLASKGIAVLRYPKRFHLHAPAVWNFTYEEEYMIDCEAAVDLLFSKFNQKVIPISHSEGGKVVSLLAQRKPKKVDGFVSLAGEVEHFLHAVIRQGYYIANITNVTIPPEQKKILEDLQKVEDLLEEGKLPKDYPIPVPFSSTSAQYLISLYNLDSIQIANELEIPFLAINGDKDYQVTLKESFYIWEDRNTNSKGEFKLINGLNHLLGIQDGVPSPVVYRTPQNVFIKVIDSIFDFVKRIGDGRNE